MTTPPRRSGSQLAPDQRQTPVDRPELSGVIVREDDIEPVKGIRNVAILFRGMAVLLALLMALQVFFGLTSTVPLSMGTMLGDAVRLLIFAGLLWGAGDLAVLAVKSHHDLRANRILTARVAYMMRQFLDADGRVPPSSGGARPDSDT